MCVCVCPRMSVNDATTGGGATDLTGLWAALGVALLVGALYVCCWRPAYLPWRLARMRNLTCCGRCGCCTRCHVATKMCAGRTCHLCTETANGQPYGACDNIAGEMVVCDNIVSEMVVCDNIVSEMVVCDKHCR